MNIKISEELKKYLIPLKEEEYLQLEENIKTDGCRDPLVLWGELLIDGHNRYEICTKHGINYSTVNRAFDNIVDAGEWMESNQLGRRNLTPDQFRYLLGRKYNRLKNKQGGNTSNRQNVALNVANDHGVSDRTVERAGAAVTDIENAIPEVAEALQAGDINRTGALDITTF